MPQQTGSGDRWIGPLAILMAHAVTLGMLFLLVVFVGRAFTDHYTAIGIGTTPRFDAVHSLSDFLSKYSISFVAIVIADALMIRWLAGKPARWLTVYSHSWLTAVVLAMFVAFTWMISPMVWNAANPALAPANQIAANSL